MEQNILINALLKIWKTQPKMSFCEFIQKPFGDDYIFHVHNDMLIKRLTDYYIKEQK
jgi:hypothetical protein